MHNATHNLAILNKPTVHIFGYVLYRKERASESNASQRIQKNTFQIGKQDTICIH